MQLALKYRPSTRSVVGDFISLAGKFDRSVIADLLCPGFPAILQQIYNTTSAILHAHGSDSAYADNDNLLDHRQCDSAVNRHWRQRLHHGCSGSLCEQQ